MARATRMNRRAEPAHAGAIKSRGSLPRSRPLSLGCDATTARFILLARPDCRSSDAWLPRQIQFTALNPTVGITFASLNSGTQGMAIDNVSISAVPEPHEWAMMLAGLGLVGWAARRNRKQGAGPAFAAA